MVCKFNTSNNNKKVIWEITNKCNYNCKYCIFNTKDDLYELPFHHCLSIANDLRFNGFDYIKFTGGEPFIRKDFIDILEYINSTGRMKFDISTNASLITEKDVDRLKNIKINFIHVSLDGCEKANDMLRGKGAFEKTLNGLKLLKKTNHYIRIGCVLFKYNQDDILKIVNMVEALGADEIIFSIMEPFGVLNGDTSFNTTRSLSEMANEIDNIKSEIKVSYNWNDKINSELLICPAGRDILFIDNKGIASPCTWISKITNKYNLSLLDYSVKEVVKKYNIVSTGCLYDLEKSNE